ncbi:hypothetical protein [Sphingobacterium hotanense]|uniref:Lipoprotein n=1 Tax=Sphingobacterium hotanense TaxID=649196 RepID=A0ABT7NLH3_9SPHI|nr:hypothetical protein [Sphingobacterium hotanense]MDM1048058.1 hypothetical protein [Sphingobacterium hotanense]
MKNLGLIMLLLFSLVGCKTRNSHVLRSSYDSSFVNRGINHVDLEAVSTRGSSSLTLSNTDWKNLIKVSGFTGTISADGKIQGTADSAEIKQSGSKNKRSNQTTNETDSTNIKGSSSYDKQGEVKGSLIEKNKQTEGFDIPWYAWLFIIISILIVLALFKK